MCFLRYVRYHGEIKTTGLNCVNIYNAHECGKYFDLTVIFSYAICTLLFPVLFHNENRTFTKFGEQIVLNVINQTSENVNY